MPTGVRLAMPDHDADSACYHINHFYWTDAERTVEKQAGRL
jgi:hypothetical protein